jgi:signal transduction histidine kinase
MSSAAVIRRILKLAPRYGAPVSEFFAALRTPRTYRPFRNPYALFGFLWGLPVPVFSCCIDLWATGNAFSLSILWEHPIHLFFLAHPILFAVVFGALGSIRHRKDREISHLVAELEHHGEELASANERLLDLDRFKAEFVANVTHELKTPLVSIRGYNEAILEERFGPLTEKQRGGLEVAVRNADRLQRLIEELLEFERIDSGTIDLAFSEFDLVPVVQATLRSFQPQVEAKRLQVSLELPDGLWVRADADRIGRVLMNLVSNAVKFAPDGAAFGVRASANGERAHVAVWDRGPGIPESAQKNLFTRFWQADGSSRRKHGGTGLGLAIVKGIMDAHGSKIRVDSREGQGTSVQFDIPLSVAAPKEVTP